MIVPTAHTIAEPTLILTCSTKKQGELWLPLTLPPLTPPPSPQAPDLPPPLPPRRCRRRCGAAVHDCDAANLRTKILDLRGFDSSIILNLRGGTIMSIGEVPESLSQAFVVGISLVGRLGVRCASRVLHAELLLLLAQARRGQQRARGPVQRGARRSSPEL